MATICYTSGTTGNPKGVMLTHTNLISNAASLEDELEATTGDTHISYLPLAHIYERTTLYTCLHNGVAIGFYRGDVLGLLDDVAALQPTIFNSVPRLWNRIYDRINGTLREGSFVSARGPATTPPLPPVACECSSELCTQPLACCGSLPHTALSAPLAPFFSASLLCSCFSAEEAVRNRLRE